MKYDLYALLNKLKSRTPMYTGGISLSSLKSYIWGACHVLSELGVEIDGPDFSQFEKWLVERFSFSGRAPGWANMVTALSLGYDPKKTRIDWESYNKNMSEGDHARSLELFFSLMDEYRQQQPTLPKQ